uniref:Uncharacterized protein n=1 Tax=Strigamia maritima TaxID=126957 RepID=T1IP00_STRMM
MPLTVFFLLSIHKVFSYDLRLSKEGEIDIKFNKIEDAGLFLTEEADDTDFNKNPQQLKDDLEEEGETLMDIFMVEQRKIYDQIMKDGTSDNLSEEDEAIIPIFYQVSSYDFRLSKKGENDTELHTTDALGSFLMKRLNGTLILNDTKFALTSST